MGRWEHVSAGRPTLSPTESQNGSSAGSFCLVRRECDSLWVKIQSSWDGGMDLDDETGTQGRFRAYASDLASVLGHADRVRPFTDYCVGLLSAEGRKSVEPLAAVTAPERTLASRARPGTIARVLPASVCPPRSYPYRRLTEGWTKRGRRAPTGAATEGQR